MFKLHMGCVWPHPPFWPRPQLKITPKMIVFKQVLMNFELKVLKMVTYSPNILPKPNRKAPSVPLTIPNVI